MLMDFAENRQATYAQEPKSLYYSKELFTLHPVVLYWKTDRGQLVRHVLMFISDDIKHDYHAVHAFTKRAIAYVKEKILLKKVMLFSDGCSGQYKCYGAFADLSLMSGVSVERLYYGSG